MENNQSPQIEIENKPVEIARGIYWVGYSDFNGGLHCNPYLIVEGDEAVLIDGGSRDDFSSVMLKILRTGISPSQITRLIYQHYDPDLCGSLPQLEAIINQDGLRVISHVENNLFIHYYSPKTPKIDYRSLDSRFTFTTGRTLEFYPIPFCHQPGSFVSYDRETKTLFSADMFGSFDDHWDLFLKLDPVCNLCSDLNLCRAGLPRCPIHGMKEFHQRVMTSNLAAQNALEMIGKLEIERIAPQHGSILGRSEDVRTALRHLGEVKNVGIEYVLSGESL